MKETIGLDIGSHSIKLVGLKMTSRGPFVTHAGIKEIPYGGEKEEPAFISEIIKALFRELGLQPGKVNLTVSDSGVHIRRMTVPAMPKAELKEAVRWEMKNHLPYPVELAQIDFHILEEFKEKDLKKLDLITVASPTDQIDRVLSIAEGAGLKPAHLSVGPFALWNCLSTLGVFAKNEMIAMINLGSEKTGIYLFRNGILQFSREVTPAGADLTRAIMEGMESQEVPDVLYKQSEAIKKTMGIPSKAFYEKNGNHLINLSKIPFLIRPGLERLMAEIGRSFDYYKNQFHADRIDRLFLTGGSANLKNIETYFADEIRLPVHRFNPLNEILFDPNRIDPQLMDQVGPAFTTALGIALPESKRIDFLPAKEPLWTRARMEKSVPRLSVLIILLVFLWLVWDMSGQVSALKKERDEKIMKVKAVEALQTRLTLLKEKGDQIKQYLSFFPSSVALPVPYREILTSMSHIAPRNVTLQFFSVGAKGKPSENKGETPTEEENELQITGLAFGSDLNCLTALAQMIEGLEESSLFKNARLVSAKENKFYNKPGVEFEVVCDIKLNHSSLSPSLSHGNADASTTFHKEGREGRKEENR